MRISWVPPDQLGRLDPAVMTLLDERGAYTHLKARANSAKVYSSDTWVQAKRLKTMILADHPLIQLLALIEMVCIETDKGEWGEER